MPDSQQVLNEAAQHHQAGRTGEARNAYLRVLESDPPQPTVFAQVGRSLYGLGFVAEAKHAFQSGIDRFPDDWIGHHNLANYYAFQNEFAKAEFAYKRAATLNPRNADIPFSLGIVLSKQGRVSEAETQFLRAVELDPAKPEYYRSLAAAMADLSHHEEAIESLTRRLLAAPDDIVARLVLGSALNMVGRSKEHVALIEEYIKNPQPLDKSMAKFVTDLFVNPEITVEDEARLLEKMFGYLKGQEVAPVKTARCAGKTKISIGYLSSFLKFTNYMSFVEDIVANHDTEKFAVTVYSGDMLGLGWVPADGAGVVVPTKDLSNKKLYEKIRADGIDILIDLDGFASFERMELLAMKPAPVIVSWYNAYSSFGIDTIDYLIGDDVVTPPDDDSHYVEEIYRLSGCYVVRNLHHGAPPVNDAAPIADNDYCTFGSFASAHKVHTGCIEAWARVLKEVPGSRLILRNSKMDEHLARFWLGEFAKYGIDTIRVELIGAANHTEFLKTYDRIDIALDCFPWNGGTTTFEAMWQGVPVVCFRGARWVSRVASSIVSAVGHPEWIGQNLDEYVQIAVDLARDPDALQRIRRGLREEMASSVLCDIAGFTKKLEVAFEDMARSKGILA